MAEDKDKTPQTLGTVLKKLGNEALGTFSNPNWGAIGQLVQTGTLSRDDVYTLSSSALFSLGSKAYNELFGIKTGGMNPPQCLISPLSAELMSLGALRKSLTGAGNEFLRKLIDQRAASLQVGYSKFPNVVNVARRNMGQNISDMLPDWMKPLIAQGTEYEEPDTTLDYGDSRERQGRKKEVGTVGRLRPLGAQAELTAEQQAFLSGYLAWAKSGFPSGYKQGSLGSKKFTDMITDMASKQATWWEEYQRQSQSLFPTSVKLRGRFGTASQR